MKRTDITALFPNATEDQIKTIMDLNGSDINKAKGDLSALQSQLSDAQTELQQLKSGGDAAGDLKKQIETLQSELNGMKQAETIRTMREKVASEKKLPAALLTGDTEDACKAQADSILAFAKNSMGYPGVQDGGEVHHASAPATRDKFAEWAKENL